MTISEAMVPRRTCTAYRLARCSAAVSSAVLTSFCRVLLGNGRQTGLRGGGGLLSTADVAVAGGGIKVAGNLAQHLVHLGVAGVLRKEAVNTSSS
ncbi:hypothetical protein TYRP_000762 [Tyrophagus putrescentiae]|nr:hypothetical protein TYRP_000762 [Tyrophagus putrescentiae]